MQLRVNAIRCQVFALIRLSVLVDLRFFLLSNTRLSETVKKVLLLFTVFFCREDAFLLTPWMEITK